MPYKRAKETVPRKDYDRAEDKLRVSVIKILRKKGFIVKRVETMAHGFGDLWVCHISGKLGGWIELKTPIGNQSHEQVEFQRLCILNRIPYLLIRSEEEAENIFYIAREFIK